MYFFGKLQSLLWKESIKPFRLS